METFVLRASCNNFITELKESFSKANVIKLGIDIQLPDNYHGNPDQFFLVLRVIATYLSDVLVNGLINIEFSLLSRQNDLVNLLVQITGQGFVRFSEVEWKALEEFIKSTDIKIRHKKEQEQISFDFHYSLRTLDSPQQVSNLPFNKKRILIVEDNEINAMVFSSFVEDWGCENIVAINGIEAVNLVHEQLFDAVLMDIHMPIMNGNVATKKIREFSEIPIVALTASSQERDIKDAMDAGVNDFLLKPVSSIQLFQVLSKYL